MKLPNLDESVPVREVLRDGILVGEEARRQEPPDARDSMDGHGADGVIDVQAPQGCVTEEHEHCPDRADHQRLPDTRHGANGCGWPGRQGAFIREV